jgi:hypothetical protein
MLNKYLKMTLPMMLVMTLMVIADDCEKAIIIEKGPCETQPNFYEYHNRISVFGPLHQAYERIKIDALYAGIEAWAVYAISDGHSHGNQVLGEGEFRMGYNYFYNGRDHVTPFLGVGVIKDYRKEEISYHTRVSGVLVSHHRKLEKPAVAYGVFGLLYDHEFNSVFNLGVNFKGLVGGAVNTHHIDWGSPVGGIDVSVPITFRFGNKRHWDIRLEPFDIYLHGSHLSRNYFGGRSTIGYRF